MINLDTPVEKLNGVGERLGERLRGAGLQTVKDLIFYYPRKWEDYRNVVPIGWARRDEEITIKGKIINIKKERSPRKRMSIVTATVGDDSGEMKAIWFNQPYLAQMLRPNLNITLHGKVDWNWQTKEKVLSSPVWVKEEKILPVYSETKGLNSGFLERLISRNLNSTEQIVDWLPEEIKDDEDLIDLPEALRQIHRPSSFEALEAAKKRLAFDELFLIALSMVEAKHEYQKERGISMKIEENILRKFTASLPFTLTPAQKKAAWEIIQDLAKPYPMNRLLEGDVGSGKTVVAAMAALVAIKNGWQAAWLAPTEILAKQHYKTMEKILGPFKTKLSLVTGTVKDDHGTAELAIGTHALIQEKIHFPKLGLVIVDEQHRFGVAQRAALRVKNKLMPHLLSMTATPIPRTLALGLYGDLDISVINQVPEGRQKVQTKIVQPEEREKAYRFIREQTEEGRQVFVICPLIEVKENGTKKQLDLFEEDRKSATSEYEKLSKEVFPDLTIGLLHGKLRPKDKEKVMGEFSEGKIDILVSTAVVEVGIDVPNATVMMIEGAERFGLAQLHQFRGRVGRGEHRSYCFLFAQSWSEITKARLTAMVESNNGFELAEKDLQLRGPGELVGLRQSGLPDLKMASLTDIIMVKQARSAAEKIIFRGLEKFPLLTARLTDFQRTRHLE